jgi:hypothetical protein
MQCEIVGIVCHIKQWGLDSDAAAKVHSQMYFEFLQSAFGAASIFLDVAGQQIREVTPITAPSNSPA